MGRSPVGDDLVREIYDLLKWGPASANSSPARFVWVRSPDGKATLAGLAAEPNKPKILKAPVTVIIGHDLDFAAELPKRGAKLPDRPLPPRCSRHQTWPR